MESAGAHDAADTRRLGQASKETQLRVVSWCYVSYVLPRCHQCCDLLMFVVGRHCRINPRVQTLIIIHLHLYRSHELREVVGIVNALLHSCLFCRRAFEW